jgi:RNA polymerase sigma factor (sigma-70 family)
MEDEQIIGLYWQRDERAIEETSRKYGAFCMSLARSILSVREDAEECVADTWTRAWNAIPPEKPASFRAWLGRVVRNLSISRWRLERAQKRSPGAESLLSELEDCVPASGSVERTAEARELSELISRWLDGLSRDDRTLFLRRYWYGQTLGELAAECGVRPERLAQRMFRLRGKLRAALEKEGVSV